MAKANCSVLLRVMITIIIFVIKLLSFSIDLLAAARITSRIPAVMPLRQGGNVNLECAGVGPPAPDVYWTRGSVRIKSEPKGQLRLTNVSHQDIGLYRCHAVNYLGRDVRETRLSKTTKV